ncbi:glycosyltransferase family 2 protein [Enterobacter cloacae]|uniref:glycosyltransferase family 2 protein n=1 Tax=Enterobacter cloacae TaxID=550 RepID=UPI000D382E56|nr:glycosyltransferase [Enterobacter cloacae]QCC91559.1 glycosyltransferase family 2 protein [Enterobacter cloacae]QCC96559.1 glycosyltransferase family 2 protein [Enterobacter cloacae]QCD11506.1 glycosyltransferase family 2 protein [Enterobacter cloacae]
MNHKRYNFICVNYNGADFCRSLCSSLELLAVPSDSQVRLIIVDNNSSEKDKVSIKQIHSDRVDIKIINLEKNIGYFPGMNHGVLYSRESDNDVIIIGNNDLKYRSDFITNLDLLNISDETLVICPDVVTIDGIHQNPLSTKKISKLGLLREDLYYSNYYISRAMRAIAQIMRKAMFWRSSNKNSNGYTEHAMNIDRGIGACYVLTNNFFKHFKKLDDRVFMWGEEALLSNQISSVNGQIRYEPSLVVEHFESGTVKKMLTRERYEIVRKSYKIYRGYL